MMDGVIHVLRFQDIEVCYRILQVKRACVQRPDRCGGGSFSFHQCSSSS